MSAIPSSAMPHTFAQEGENLRDPHGRTIEERETSEVPRGVLYAGAAVLALFLWRAVR